MMNHKLQIYKLQNCKPQMRSWEFCCIQAAAVLLYIRYLIPPRQVVVTSQEYEFAGWIAAAIGYAFWLAVSVAISLAVTELTRKPPPKPRRSQPTGLEQFSLPTAEEGRALQVLFGKRYIEGPNVVWYGNLKSEPIIIRA